MVTGGGGSEEGVQDVSEGAGSVIEGWSELTAQARGEQRTTVCCVFVCVDAGFLGN